MSENETPSDPFAPVTPPPGSPDDPSRPRGDRASEAPAAAASEPPPPPAPTIAVANPAHWTKEVALRGELIVDGVPLTKITVRRLTTDEVIDLLGIEDSETSLNRRVRAAMCGVHPAVLGALDPDDAADVADAIRPFYPRALVGADAMGDALVVLTAVGEMAAAA